MDKKYDVLTSGYVSMDRIIKIKTPAKVGFTSLVSNKTSADVQYGGCSVNISYNLCKLDLCAMPIMRVGDDYIDNGFKAFLKDANVPLDALTLVEGERTSLCYLVQDNMGEHITLFYPGAMDSKFFIPTPDTFFQNAQLGLIAVGARPDNEDFLAKCKKNNLPLVFSMKGDFDAFPEQFLKELLEYCTILFTNEVERETIENMYGESMLELFNKGNAKLIVTTLGKKGSRCYAKTDTGIKEYYVPIFDGGPVKDTTGSGDAYISGFLYGYLTNRSPKECAMLGTVLSSFIIEEEGCCTNAPTQDLLNVRYNTFKTLLKGEE